MNIKLLFILLIVLAANSAVAAKRPAIVGQEFRLPARDVRALDMSVTGKDGIAMSGEARALLRLANGGVIKLGQNGLYVLDELDQKQSRLKEFVTTSLVALSGAFRFTAQALSRYRGECETRLTLVTSIAGIRG